MYITVIPVGLCELAYAKYLTQQPMESHKVLHINKHEYVISLIIWHILNP